MQKLLTVLLFAAYSLGIFQAGSPLAYGNVTKVTVTHTHHIHDHEHSHDHGDEETPANDDSPVHSNAGNTHSHEMFVCGAVPYLVNSTVPTLYSFEPSSTVHAHIEHRPPLDLRLGSIFRPPIV